MAFSNQIGITGTGDTVIPLELASSHILGFEEEDPLLAMVVT